MAILKNYVVPKAVNPFAGTIDELIDAGEGAAFEHTAKTEDIATDKRNLQNAAREAGYSARVVENEDNGKGSTRIVIVLGPKRTRRSKAELAEAGEPEAEAVEAE